MTVLCNALSNNTRVDPREPASTSNIWMVKIGHAERLLGINFQRGAPANASPTDETPMLVDPSG